MQHLTAIRMLLLAKARDKRVDIVVRGASFRVEAIERIVVSSKEARLVSGHGLEGLQTDKALPPEMQVGELNGPVVLIVGQLRNEESTTNEFKTSHGCLLIDTDDVSAIAVRDL